MPKNISEIPKENPLQRILIIEDDTVIADMVKKGLERWGFSAHYADDFQHVLELLERFQPHLVLLDVSLPFYNGYYWCQQIRQKSTVPIVFISSRTEDMDIVLAIQMGGDDYITKPFSLEVLVAKIQAILRRSSNSLIQTELLLGSAQLNLGEGALYTEQGKIDLTKNELRILQLLLEQKGQIVARETIMLRLWDSDSYIDDNTLTVNINRLRKKLEAHGLANCIVTRRGEGYLLHDG